MKKHALKKLVLNRETLQNIDAPALEGVAGGATPSIIASIVITMLSCGFFCNPRQAR